jgi:Xaa-Pro aminopeptidase
MGSENLLMFADSERDANMLYAARIFLPDPFVYLRLKGKAYLLLNEWEVDRARKQAPHCRVLPLSRSLDRRNRSPVRASSPAGAVCDMLRTRRIETLFVPASFPHGLAQQLRRLGVKLKLKQGAFFPERERKSPLEVKKISAALIMAEVGMAEGMQALKNSRIGKGGRLFYHNVPLTSEKLRSTIEIAILQAGGSATRTIVASGCQTCDPYEPGYGPLRANEPIIIDISPRSQKTGYFGDITRTVVRGRASEPVRKLYDTVIQAQRIAFRKMRPGTPGVAVHQAVLEFFNRAGYPTCRRNGRMEGFFHGVGHGLGLEIHEPPHLSTTTEDVLEPGHVVTVEPGLYYPGLGGVRMEDVALVTQSAPRNLTKFEKVLEL